jgi:hypothetical protein
MGTAKNFHKEANRVKRFLTLNWQSQASKKTEKYTNADGHLKHHLNIYLEFTTVLKLIRNVLFSASGVFRRGGNRCR